MREKKNQEPRSKNQEPRRLKWEVSSGFITILALLLVLFSGCRDDVAMVLSEDIAVGNPEVVRGYKSFYLLNEANMGSSKATSDYYDFTTGI